MTDPEQLSTTRENIVTKVPNPIVDDTFFFADNDILYVDKRIAYVDVSGIVDDNFV